MSGHRTRLVLGPPGTGKTTELLKYLEAEVESGVPVEAIAFMTFTRAGRDEVRHRVGDRFGVSPDDLPWFRTLHSAAYRLLGLRRRNVMAGEAWGAFARRYGYSLTEVPKANVEDDLFAPPSVTPDDALRLVVEWSRNQRLDIDAALKKLQRTGVAVQSRQVGLFAERAAAYRAENELVDFPGMLERVLDGGLRPHLMVAFVDEAQDLSPLQIAVVEHWFAGCARVYVAGDDDQAIYDFQGADPQWLLALNDRSAAVKILRQSYRVPAKIHQLAGYIIRQNRARVAKRYEPRSEAGSVLVLPPDRVLSAVGDAHTVFVLARNRIHLRPWVDKLRDADEPFVVEGPARTSLLDDTAVARAVSAATRLRERSFIFPEGLRALLRFVPSRGADLLPCGAKAQAERHHLPITREELESVWGMGRLMAHLDTVGPVHLLSKLRLKDRQYLARLLAKHGRIPEPRFRLMSIHASKGREADVVVVISDMSRTSYAQYVGRGREGEETEHRVAYVAVTRARHRLILVEPTTRRSYPYLQSFLKANALGAIECPHYRPLPLVPHCRHHLDGGMCGLPGGFLCVERFDEARVPTPVPQPPASCGVRKHNALLERMPAKRLEGRR